MNDIRFLTVKSNSRLPTDTMIMSRDLAKDMREAESFVLRAGQLSMFMHVKASRSDRVKNTINLNPSAIKKLRLKDGKKYGSRLVPGELAVGPFVGVMAEIYNQPGKPFGGQSLFIRQLISNAHKLGMVCYGFAPGAIDWERKVIHGYTHGTSGWTKAVFPIPDVVYPRERGYSAANRRIRYRMESMGVQMINPLLIGKWQTHQVISNNRNLTQYIPDTRLITSFKQVDSMIKKYNAVYLKPVAGSQGKNIIKVVKKGGAKIYTYQYQYNNKTVRGTAASLSALQRNLRGVMGNRRYIIQKQINLLTSGGNILDVRALVQKDDLGEWSVTGVACRIGRDGSITSNISSGGKGRRLDAILRSKFHDEALVESIEREVNYLAIEAARTLEMSIGQSGEMGVDIGVDRSGRLWFIEANLRPARQVFNLIGERGTRLQSVVKPLHYSRYLAGFSMK